MWLVAAALIVSLATVLVGALYVVLRRRRVSLPADEHPNLGIGIGVGIAVGAVAGMVLWTLTGQFIWYSVCVAMGLSLGVALGQRADAR